jgi:hypothetical protein
MDSRRQPVKKDKRDLREHVVRDTLLNSALTESLLLFPVWRIENVFLSLPYLFYTMSSYTKINPS